MKDICKSCKSRDVEPTCGLCAELNPFVNGEHDEWTVKKDKACKDFDWDTIKGVENAAWPCEDCSLFPCA